MSDEALLELKSLLEETWALFYLIISKALRIASLSSPSGTPLGALRSFLISDIKIEIK